MNQLEHYKAVKARLGLLPQTRNTVARPPERKAPPQPINPPEPEPEVKATYQEHRVVSRERDRTITVQMYLDWYERAKPDPVELSIPASARPIVNKVCRKHKITVQQLFLRTRLQCLIMLRFEVYFALYANGFGFAEIGRMFKRDHTTVMHGVNMWKEREGGEHTDYIADPAAVARRLSARRNNVSKCKARAEVIGCLERLGAVAARGAGEHLPEAGEDHVGELL